MSIYDNKSSSVNSTTFTPASQMSSNWLKYLGGLGKFSDYYRDSTQAVRKNAKNWMNAPIGAGFGMNRGYANAYRHYRGQNPTWYTNELQDRVDQGTVASGRQFSQQQIDNLSREAARLGTSSQPGVNAAKEQARYNNSMQTANQINQNKLIAANQRYNDINQTYGMFQSAFENGQQLQLARDQMQASINQNNKDREFAKQQQQQQMALAFTKPFFGAVGTAALAAAPYIGAGLGAGIGSVAQGLGADVGREVNALV